MANALRDQLLKAGLVNEKQLKQAAKEKNKEIRRQHGQGLEPQESAAEQARRLAADKTERDRQLNLQRREEAERKAQAAQLKQLVEANRLHLGDGDIAYHFSDGGSVKRLYVSGRMRDQLAAGRLVVVRCGGQYSVVAVDTGQRIRERHPDAIVVWNEPTAALRGDDPYAGYEVPDDLIW